MAINDNIELRVGPFMTNKFQFYTYYEEKQLPIKKNRPYFVWVYKDKSVAYVYKNEFIFPYNDKSNYASYINILPNVQREKYIRPTQLVVTDKHRDKGFVIRFFAKSVFDPSIFEINKASFSLETNFYHKVQLTWYLDNDRDMMERKNKEQIKNANNTLDGIDNHLDPLEFYKEKIEMTKQEKVHEKLNRLKHY